MPSRSRSGASTRSATTPSTPPCTGPGSRSLTRLPARAMFVPPSGHMAGIWARTDDTRGVHKAPANEVVRGALALELQITKGEHDQLNPSRHQLHPCVPGSRHPRLGRPHAVERPVLALPQRPPAVQLHRGVDPRGHPVGRLRAQRPQPVAARQAHDQRVPDPRLARRRPVRGDARGGVLRQVRRRDQPARRDRRRPADRRDRHRARQAGRIRDLPHRAVLGRRVAQRITRRPRARRDLHTWPVACHHLPSATRSPSLPLRRRDRRRGDRPVLGSDRASHPRST